MLAQYTFLFAAMQAGFAAAVGNSVVSNRCDHDVYVSSVSKNQAAPFVKIPARSQWKQAFNTCDGCATSLKVSNTDELVAGAHTQLEYTVAGGQLWYDISLVNCAEGQDGAACPGWDKGLSINTTESACGNTQCQGSTFCTASAYFVDTPLLKLGTAEPVFTCPGAGLNMDLVYTLCSDEAPIKRSIAGRLSVDAM
jgi:hypothetical protein